MNTLSANPNRWPRWEWGVLLFAWWLLLYGLTNHWQIFEPARLSYHWGEEQVPFILWTIAPYLSLIPLLLSALFIIKPADFKRAIFWAAGLIALHSLFFLFFPTYYPRPALPAAPAAANFLYAALIWFDSPQNCFPSLHVALAMFFSLLVWRAKRTYGLVFFGWSLVIAVSTLTTKQHYIIDIFGGLATALGAYYIAFHFRPFQRTIR